MRLFVALDVPESHKRQIQKICTGLPDIRWVKPEQIHLTMRFIGEANKEQVAAIKTALGQITFEPFDFALQGVGQFPPKRTPRVIWVGLTKSPAAVQLAQKVEKTIVDLGFPPEDKPFSPHITLARIKTPPSQTALDRFYATNASFQSDPFTISEFVLYSSTLTPGGSIYKKEAVYGAK